jgi:hypothetical protein
LFSKQKEQNPNEPKKKIIQIILIILYGELAIFGIP